MQNISEVVKSIKESRSNAPLNINKRPTEEVAQAAKSLGYPSKVVGVSMTGVDKLGINPGSPYTDTPLGIYAYPYRWIDYSKPEGVSIASFLPFQQKAPYINVFSIKPSAKVVNIGDAKQSEEIIEKILDFLNNLPLDGDQVDDLYSMRDDYDDFWEMSYKAAEIYETVSPRKRYGAAEAEVGDGEDFTGLNKVNFSIAWKAESVILNLWEILFLDSEVEVSPPNVKGLSPNQRKQLAMKLQKSISKSRRRSDDAPSVVKRRPLLWNKLLREVGVDVVVDMGYGKIHPMEENQMVIFNPSAIEKVIRVENVWQREKNPETKKEDAGEIIEAGLRKGTLTKRAAIQILQLPEDAKDENIYTSTKYAKEFAPIRNSIYRFIVKNLFTLLLNHKVEEFDRIIKFVEGKFNKLSVVSVSNLLNRLGTEQYELFDLQDWSYLINFVMQHISPEQVNSDSLYAEQFIRLLTFLSSNYQNRYTKISMEQKKDLLRSFFATDYWKQIERNGEMRSVKTQAQDFLNKDEE